MCKKIMTNTCSFKEEEELLYKFSKSDYISFSFFVKKCLRQCPEFKEFKEEYYKEHPELYKSI